MSTPYTIAQRRKLLDDYFAALERTRELTGPRDEDVALISKLWDEYVEGTPVLNLSRDPFTGEAARHSIDPYGLDGLWWNYDAPARPPDKEYFGFSGAVKLGSHVEVAPFLCKPGPEVPFVIPRILERDEIRAVVSSLHVGEHVGYPIFYFANPTPFDLERVNTWGTDSYRFETESGEQGWYSSSWEQSDFDFDLRPWISAGKLLWIAAGDPELALHKEVDGCPYLDLEGRRYPLNIEGGEVWSAASWSEAPPEPAGRFCPNCGAQVKTDSKFCPSCGTKL